MDTNTAQEGPFPTHIDSDPHIKETEIAPQPEENVETLRAEVSLLREQLAVLQGEAKVDMKKYIVQLNMLTSGAAGWTDYDRKALGDEVRLVLYEVRAWCLRHARRDLPDATELSAMGKQAIIRSLDGYLVQDLDWETLMKSVPYPFPRMMSFVLAQMVLSKEIMEKFFVNPFWYIQGEESETEGKATSPVSCAQQLQDLYQKYLESNPLRASRWKTETVRLSNSTLLTQAPKVELGWQTKKHREKSVSSFVSSRLSDIYFQSLLKSVGPDEAKKRADGLLKLYQLADQTAFILAHNQGYCLYKTLANVGSTFDRKSELTRAHGFHFLHDPDDSRLDGRRILGICNPAMRLRLNSSNLEDDGLFVEAEVLVEHGDYTEEDHARDGPKLAAEPDEKVENAED
ncbi:hypothetical protein AbraIFM66950_006461 [Aspergillus brasiliensis]|nr:hypothetical protein AbraIFM66950_006461 [Aspergillus brasiliensis]